MKLALQHNYPHSIAGASFDSAGRSGPTPAGAPVRWSRRENTRTNCRGHRHARDFDGSLHPSSHVFAGDRRSPADAALPPERVVCCLRGTGLAALQRSALITSQAAGPRAGVRNWRPTRAVPDGERHSAARDYGVGVHKRRTLDCHLRGGGPEPPVGRAPQRRSLPCRHLLAA